MSKVFIEESTLTAIGDSIRGKTGKTELINPTNMPAEISSIQGGSTGSLPAITGNCNYMFAYDNWNWFIDLYGSTIKTQNIENAGYMFEDCQKLRSIPFDINFVKSDNYNYELILQYMFSGCSLLVELPKINYPRPISIASLFDSCDNLRYIPDDFDSNWDWSYIDREGGQTRRVFNLCYSLRRLPINMLKHGCRYISNSSSWYYNMCQCCYSLDEIIGLPIPYSNTTWTGNAFSGSFTYCGRLKEMTFATQEDGTPYIMQWRNQTIDFTYNTGFARNISEITNYNSGITADKQVKDDASYQALKDDPDWFTTDFNYSRYNHTSAVNTINSLPDTSAYLANAGGTNTIKFKGAAGALTDGGAINTLTEEEIAVATAKGWTVTLV